MSDSTIRSDDPRSVASAGEGTEASARLSPAPNVPECTCDRDDDSWVGESSVPLCPYHEGRLRYLSWDSLACMVIDYEAAITKYAKADADGDGAMTTETRVCPDCDHPEDEHSRGGMCGGEGTVCHCVRMAPIEDAVSARPSRTTWADIRAAKGAPEDRHALLREMADLGFAWAEVEAALPEGVSLSVDCDDARLGYVVTAYRYHLRKEGPVKWVVAREAGPLVPALRTLAATLRALA